MHALYLSGEYIKTNLQRVQAVGLGRVGRDGVEDVDQDEEEGDQQRHATLEIKTQTLINIDKLHFL